MKLSTETSPVEISGAIGKPQRFGIKASKEAFKILSSGLYNNKIRAIIRELACNCYDAHVAAGKRDKPFELHLPTRLEPHFEIKDYGTGLADQEVFDLYTTYFATDKSNSNDFIGALGLGSKSPFCYTEGFTVVSRYQGTATTFACYINEEGMPDILLQTKEVTTESNGLTVSFPVNKEDCWEFENQAKSALEFFDPLPKINTDIDVVKKEYQFKSTTWGMRTNDSNTNPRAIQGLVAYAVGSIDQSRLNPKQQRLLELPIDIFFPIGELSVAASRESLSNDERTIGNILKALDGMAAVFLDEVKAKVNQCKTVWDARILLFNMINTPGLGGIVNEAFNRGEFVGNYGAFSLDKSDLKIQELLYPNLQIVRFSRSWRNESAEKYVMSTPLDKRETKKAIGSDLSIKFKAEGDVLFVINDIGFGVEKYIHYFIQACPDNRTKQGNRLYDTVYFLTRATKDTQVAQVVTEAQVMLSNIGFPPVKLVSEFKQKYQSVLSRAKPSTPAAKRDYIRWNIEADVSHERENRDGSKYRVQGWRDGWMAASAPPQGVEKFYVRVSSLAVTTERWSNAEEFQDFVQAAINCEYLGLPEDPLIYGINDSSPLLKQMGGWIELVPYIIQTLKTYMTPSKQLQMSLHLNPFQSKLERGGLLKELATTKPLSPDSLIQKFAIELEGAKKFNEIKISNLMRVVKKAESLGAFKIEHVVDFNAQWKEVVAAYPLLDVLNGYYYGSVDINKELIQYFKLVDRERVAPLVTTVTSVIDDCGHGFTCGMGCQQCNLSILQQQEKGEEENVTVI